MEVRGSMVKLFIILLLPIFSFGQANKFSGFGSRDCGTTNMILKSEDFSDAVWTKLNTTITTDATTSPTGTTTADKVSETTGNGYHYVVQTVFTANNTYTFSVYAKQGTTNKIWVGVSDNLTGTATGIFDLSDGSSSAGTLGDGTMTSVSYGTESAANGFYRCWVTATINSGSSVALFAGIINGAGTYVYTGNASNDVYIWGAQLTSGAGLKCYKATN